MKIFTHSIFSHRRIILIFFLAIFLPLTIAMYLSLSTFPKRRDAVKKLLESNLWISGEAALKSIEGTLLYHEQNALQSENFARLIQSVKAGRGDYISTLSLADSVGQLFLLDPDFNIVFPETARENSFSVQIEKGTPNIKFGQALKNAQFFEFTGKDYIKAAGFYKECVISAPSDQYRAISYEGLGRTLFSCKEYDDAEKVYNELSKNYSKLLNEAGHPFGITALFQLYELSMEKNEEESGLAVLLSLYKKMLEGNWIISQPSYDFYISEIESILNAKLLNEKFPELQNSYSELQKRQFTYRQVLEFTNFIKSYAIPGIKEKLSLSGTKDEALEGRFLTDSGNKLFLLSYSLLTDFQGGQTFYSGLRWDIDLLKDKLVAKILEDVSKDSALDLKLVNEGELGTVTEKADLSSGNSMTLAFRTFPLPWKLLVSNPEMEAINKTANREILFYGILLGVIVFLVLLGAVLIARDISRESETTHLKTEFVNNISHELKTPLTLIRLYGETLQRKENLTNEEKKECYEIITKESERLSHLINNVLDFSRIEMGRKEFNFKKGSLQEVIQDTLDSYQYHLEKKGFTVHTDISRNLPEMNFDGEAIASVLINLLSNAMKFSPREKVVIVKLLTDNDSAVLQVADKGTGIPQKEIPRIFERFYQSENKIASETKGSGLGLTLVKHTVEAHGGKIEVESEVGKGSVFTIRIPLVGI